MRDRTTARWPISGGRGHACTLGHSSCAALRGMLAQLRVLCTYAAAICRASSRALFFFVDFSTEKAEHWEREGTQQSGYTKKSSENPHYKKGFLDLTRLLRQIVVTPRCRLPGGLAESAVGSCDWGYSMASIQKRCSTGYSCISRAIWPLWKYTVHGFRGTQYKAGGTVPWCLSDGATHGEMPLPPDQSAAAAHPPYLPPSFPPTVAWSDFGGFGDRPPPQRLCSHPFLRASSPSLLPPRRQTAQRWPRSANNPHTPRRARTLTLNYGNALAHSRSHTHTHAHPAFPSLSFSYVCPRPPLNQPAHSKKGPPSLPPTPTYSPLVSSPLFSLFFSARKITIQIFPQQNLTLREYTLASSHTNPPHLYSPTLHTNPHIPVSTSTATLARPIRKSLFLSRPICLLLFRPESSGLFRF